MRARAVRLIGITVLVLGGGRAAGAQVAMGAEARTAAVRDAGSWRPAQAVTSWLRADRPWASAELDATLGGRSAGEGATWVAGGTLSGALFTPYRAGFRGVLQGSASRAAPYGTASVDEARLGARLSYRRGATGVWLGSEVESVRDDSGASRPSVEAGIWRQIGGAVLTLSIGSRSTSYSARDSSTRRVLDTVVTIADSLGGFRTDTVWNFITETTRRAMVDHWSDTRAGIYWARGRLMLNATGGGRLAKVHESGTAWARGEAALAITSRFSLVAGAGKMPARLSVRVPARRYATLGMRLSHASFLRPSLPPVVQSTASAFRLERLGVGRYRIAVRVPGARTVELSGDFTNWSPVTLERASADLWTTTIAVTPGTYRLNIRVDGAGWIAPPGATQVSDDFAGDVGVIVIP